MTAQEFIAHREALGLSTSELAKLIGVHHSTLWRWEAEEQPVPQYAALIADLLLNISETTLARRYGLD